MISFIIPALVWSGELTSSAAQASSYRTRRGAYVRYVFVAAALCCFAGKAVGQRLERPASKEPELVALDELNTAAADWLPWATPDGLSIYWQVNEPGKPEWIWTASRRDRLSRFEAKKALFPGRHPTVTADGMQIVFVPVTGGKYPGRSPRIATRTTRDQPFGDSVVIQELRAENDTEEREAPALAPDGLTLYFQRADKGQDGRWHTTFWYSTRKSLTSPWQAAQQMPMNLDRLPDRALTWPFLTADRLRLFCVNQGRKPGFMVWSRASTTKPFEDPQYLDFPRINLFGRPARYVEATDELFFSFGRPEGQNGWDLHVIKNAGLGKGSLPSAGPGSSKPAGEAMRVPPKAATREVPAQFRAVLEKACKESNLPAVGAAVIVDGRLFAADAVGVRKLGTQTQVTADDAFHIGSCAKALTATVIARLVEDGKLRWDTSVGDIFPRLKATTRPAYGTATVEQLLGHRAGFPRNPSLPPPLINNLPGRNLREKRLAFVDHALRLPPVAQPGHQFEYSNVGYTVAAAMAEQVTNKEWEALQQELLFKPLEMNGIHFGNSPAGGENSRPWGHLSLGGRVTPHPPGPNVNDPPLMSPAGSVVHCPMHDLAKFVTVHLGVRDGDKSLLKPETLKRLHTPQAANDSYASGWMRTRLEGRDDKVLTHAGANPMNYCAIWLVPDRKFAIVVATNIGPDRAAKPCSDVCGQLLDMYLK
jgi:CubicO group peptidase (beta-lactamase class C family)